MSIFIPIGLYVLYGGLFSWYLIKGKGFDGMGLPRIYWLLIFLLKAVAAGLYGWWYAKLPGDLADTWWFYREAMQYQEILTKTPLQFFSDFIPSDPENQGGILHHRGFWNDLRGHVFIRFFSILLFLGAGNYYVASLFFAMMGFWSGYLFCKSFIKLTRSPITWVEVGLLCCLPSVLFWSSGIHRDAILLLCLSGICWQMVRRAESPWGRQGLFTALMLIPILIFRTYWAIILIPTLLTWFLIPMRWKSYTVPALFGANGAALLIFLLNPSLLQQLMENRQAFLDLEGKSLLTELTLEASPLAFVAQIPQGLTNFCWIPTKSPGQGILYGLSQVEMAALFLLAAGSFLQYRSHKITYPTHAYLMALFCMILMAGILIGWTIPYAGALVRYRAPFLTLITLGIVLSRRRM